MNKLFANWLNSSILRKYRSGIALWMIGLGWGFCFFSLLAWRGFWLVDKNSAIPWMQMITDEMYASIFWWNYVVLALTIFSFMLAVIGLVIYIFVEDLPETNST
jgi:hypothetical protein